MTEIIVSLAFDSWAEDLPGLRGARMGDRHLIYEGGGVILDLLVKQTDDGSFLHIGGQMLPEDNTIDSISNLPVIIEHGKKRYSTHTNALGEFTIQSVPNGTFDLAITLGDRRFTVQGLSNKEPHGWRVVSSVSAGGA